MDQEVSGSLTETTEKEKYSQSRHIMYANWEWKNVHRGIASHAQRDTHGLEEKERQTDALYSLESMDAETTILHNTTHYFEPGADKSKLKPVGCACCGGG